MITINVSGIKELNAKLEELSKNPAVQRIFAEGVKFSADALIPKMVETGLLNSARYQSPVHHNSRCAVQPFLSNLLPGDDVVIQAERVVIEYEARRSSGADQR